MNWTLNDNVMFIQQRCACDGGGSTEQKGTIIGTVPDNFGIWYQISTSNGVFYARAADIIKAC